LGSKCTGIHKTINDTTNREVKYCRGISTKKEINENLEKGFP
jgi:hypothetical protein